MLIFKMDTEVEELALLALIIRRRRKRRKKERKMWVRKLYQTREQIGAFPPLAKITFHEAKKLDKLF